MERERLQHRIVIRKVSVVAVRSVALSIARVTIGGGDLVGFTAPGPADHVKVFFPDPATGILTAPILTDRGVRAPQSASLIARDYTPLAFRPNGPQGPELDIDFVLHGDDGPATIWAAQAAVGDELVLAGPRGSHLPPTDIRRLIVIADETALPAAARWIDTVGPGVAVTGLFSVADPGTSEYVTSVRPSAQTSTRSPTRASTPVSMSAPSLHWFSGPDRMVSLADALCESEFDDRTLCFLAGEAGEIMPLRRYLRRDRRLPSYLVDGQGYWKRGVANPDEKALAAAE